MQTFLLFGYFATWGFIPHLLLLKKRPAATLAWLWAILFIPWLGTLAYCALGIDRLKRWNLFSARASRQLVPASNLDYRSMRLNSELNLIFHSIERNREVAAILEHDFTLCREIEPTTFSRRPFWQKFAEATLRSLSPLL